MDETTVENQERNVRETSDLLVGKEVEKRRREVEIQTGRGREGSLQRGRKTREVEKVNTERKDHRSQQDQLSPTNSTGSGWRGELPRSDHPRWTESTNKGQVKRGKQDFYARRRD